MNKQATSAHTKALANCAQNWHQWHPTFTVGGKLCLGRDACLLLLLSEQAPSERIKLLACAPRRSERKEAEA